jgi:hypothetical protein
MNPDLVASLIAFIRLNAGLVSAFGDSAQNPAFWSNYNALQVSPADPIMPYLVFVEPSESKSYETKDATGKYSNAADGILAVDIYAPTELLVRQLGEQLCTVVNDCDESVNWTTTGLFFFRRLNQAMPPLPATGPDSSPTVFRRQIQFRYMYEETAT